MSPMKRPADDLDPDVARSISIRQLAARWGVTERRLRRWLFRGHVEFMRIDGQFRVPFEVVHQIERTQGRPPKLD